jgi:hypothetical protein
VTVVDCAKPEHSSLLPLYNARGRELAVLTPAELPVNLVWPAGLTAAQARAVMPGIYARLLRIEAGTEVVLREAFELALRGPMRACFWDLVAAVGRVESAFPLAKASLDAKLRPLGAEARSMMARVREPAPIAAWRTTNTVVDLSGASETLRALVVIVLLLGLLRGAATGGVHLIFVDDAARLLALDALIEGLGPISELAGVVRARGVAFGVGVQSWVGLVPSVAANLNTKLIFGVGSGHDMVRVAGDLQLTPEQIDAVHSLETGHAVLQLPAHVWPDPILVAVPDVPAIPVDDATAARSAALVHAWPHTLAAEYPADWTPPRLRPIRPAGGPPAGGLTPPGDGLSSTERRVLEAIAMAPRRPAHTYKAGAQWSRAVAARKVLLAKGLVRVVKDVRAGRGRKADLLEITPAGLAVLRPKGGS